MPARLPCRAPPLARLDTATAPIPGRACPSPLPSARLRRIALAFLWRGARTFVGTSAPARTSAAATRREAQTKALGEVQQGVRVGGCYYVLLTYYFTTMGILRLLTTVGIPG